MQSWNQATQKAAANGYGNSSWTETNDEKFQKAVRRKDHKNANGGNGKYGIDQKWANSLGMSPERKQSVLQGLRSNV